VYAHIFLRHHNAPINPDDPQYQSNRVVYYRHSKYDFEYSTNHGCAISKLMIFHLALTKFYPKKAIVKAKNLLKGSISEEEPVVGYEETEGQAGMTGLLGNWTRKAPLVAYWHPNVTINIISDAKSAIAKRSVTPPMWKCKSISHCGSWGLFHIVIHGTIIRKVITLSFP